MKRVLPILAGLFCIARTVQAQGTVDFGNSLSSLISTNSSPGGPPTGLISGPVGSYYFALFSAPVGATDPAQFVFVGAYATNVTIAGGLRGGFPSIPGT